MHDKENNFTRYVQVTPGNDKLADKNFSHHQVITAVASARSALLTRYNSYEMAAEKTYEQLSLEMNELTIMHRRFPKTTEKIFIVCEILFLL